MQAIIDHIGAVIISAAIILLIAAMQLRSQDASIGAQQVDAGKSGLRLLVDMVEQDFNNMGSGMETPNDSAAVSVITTFGPEGSYTVLKFYALPSRDGAPEPQLITYRWTEDGQTQLNDGTTVDTYRVERLVGGASDGSSFNNITAFDINLFEDDLDPVSAGSVSYHMVRYVSVDVTMVSPLGTDGILERMRWAKQYRPINLSAESRNRLRIVLPTS